MACANGFFYIYEVNTQTGGECKLLSQTSILTSNRNAHSQLQTGSSSWNSIGKETVK